MSAATQPLPLLDPAPPAKGASVELRRFSAGMRSINALLCTLLLAATEQRISVWALTLLLTYGTWAAYLLWQEAAGRSRGSLLLHFWIDVAWSVATLQLVATGTPMLVITLVQPVVLASIAYGVPQGVALALFGAAGVLFDHGGGAQPHLDGTPVLLTLVVLFVVPGAALLAHPMNQLRSRMALLGQLGAQLDPRRGLEPICLALAGRLRQGTQAELVALVLPSAVDAPAVVSSREDGSFRAGAEVHSRIEALLAGLPNCAATHTRRSWWDPRRATRLSGDAAPSSEAHARLAQLAELLGVRSLHVVPLIRYTRRHGHLLAGYQSATPAASLGLLSAAAPELLRVVEQAALVDQLQEESASHERARIGRDLHDSAIQPYLGLKYAVECVALRIPHDNPARAEVEALAELVNSEVGALRELISGLRSGDARGDNALVPAVRRQVKRFALLFGIEIELDCPDQLPTTRALASALFHMVNEALNNVRKHTPARHVWIRLAGDARGIRLTVRDDGGCVAGRPCPEFSPGSLGERARELGGTLTIHRPDGLNTELVIDIPL